MFFGKLTLLLAAMALTFTGCGYRRPAQVKTTGTVTLDGEPVANASLMFIPDSGRPASATQTPMENFKVSSFGGNDGLPAGNYRVTAKDLFSKKDSKNNTTEQVDRAKAEAEPGEEPEEVDIEFGENAYENDLPEKYAELDTTDITVTITKQQEPLVIH